MPDTNTITCLLAINTTLCLVKDIEECNSCNKTAFLKCEEPTTAVPLLNQDSLQPSTVILYVIIAILGVTNIFLFVSVILCGIGLRSVKLQRAELINARYEVSYMCTILISTVSLIERSIMILYWAVLCSLLYLGGFY